MSKVAARDATIEIHVRYEFDSQLVSTNLFELSPSASTRRFRASLTSMVFMIS